MSTITEEILSHVDPDCSYGEWMTVAREIKNQFRGNEAEGFLIFNRWSAGGKKYAGPVETQTKWDSIKPSK